MAISKSKAVARTEAYYDSEAADAFYQSFWGGEDIHIGSYKNDGETIADAGVHMRVLGQLLAVASSGGPGGLDRDLRRLPVP